MAKGVRLRGITFSGPFFEADPRKTFFDNRHDFMETIARAGEAEVRARVASAPRRTRGHRVGDRDPTQAYVRGRVVALAGKTWARTAVVSPVRTGLSRAEAISLYAAAASLERRYHPFRSGKNAVRRAAKQAARDLIKGL